MNIFLREEGHRGSRPPYQRLYFRVARYNRRRMPMFYYRARVTWLPKVLHFLILLAGIMESTHQPPEKTGPSCTMKQVYTLP